MEALSGARPAARVGPAAEHEIEAVAALMHEVVEPLAYYNGRARAAELGKYTADSIRAMVADDPQSVLVARDSGGLAGFCVSRFDDGTIWLSWFGTAARVRGRGVGAALLAALAETLAARHAHKIWCDSRTDNTESRSVLERAGFHRIATLTNHWYGQDYFLWEWYPPSTAKETGERGETRGSGEAEGEVERSRGERRVGVGSVESGRLGPEKRDDHALAAPLATRTGRSPLDLPPPLSASPLPTGLASPLCLTRSRAPLSPVGNR